VSDAREGLIERLARAGCVAAEEEAAELTACAEGDDAVLDGLVTRRLTGEPLAWITGSTVFCGIEIAVAPGVYVPRWQSEDLARRAVARFDPSGTAVDLCTGSGALAVVLARAYPAARVLASDLDAAAVACARSNGVETYHGDLFGPLPVEILNAVDLVTAVVPYVPTPALALLAHDTLVFESPFAYDGGREGIDLLRRVVADSPSYLRRGGALLVELGGGQAELLAADLARHNFVNVVVLRDEDDEVRGIEATFAG
jgi:release factor glutamine methyltransferase